MSFQIYVGVKVAGQAYNCCVQEELDMHAAAVYEEEEEQHEEEEKIHLSTRKTQPHVLMC